MRAGRVVVLRVGLLRQAPDQRGVLEAAAKIDIGVLQPADGGAGGGVDRPLPGVVEAVLVLLADEVGDDVGLGAAVEGGVAARDEVEARDDAEAAAAAAEGVVDVGVGLGVGVGEGAVGEDDLTVLVVRLETEDVEGYLEIAHVVNGPAITSGKK